MTENEILDLLEAMDEASFNAAHTAVKKRVAAHRAGVPSKPTPREERYAESVDLLRPILAKVWDEGHTHCKCSDLGTFGHVNPYGGTT